MKTIGLIGGMSWESTVSYYQIINEEVKRRLGGLHSAKVILYSVEFDEIEKCQSDGDWKKSGDILGTAAKSLEAAGADFILICTNTMHKVVPQIESMIQIPIIHIADATAQELLACQIRKVGLLGTKYTMTQDIDTVNDIIFHELCVGNIREESRRQFQRVIDNLKAKGAHGVILGCTEIGLLIHQTDSSLPVFDTTVIHAKQAVELALEV